MCGRRHLTVVGLQVGADGLLGRSLGHTPCCAVHGPAGELGLQIVVPGQDRQQEQPALVVERRDLLGRRHDLSDDVLIRTGYSPATVFWRPIRGPVPSRAHCPHLCGHIADLDGRVVPRTPDESQYGRRAVRQVTRRSDLDEDRVARIRGKMEADVAAYRLREIREDQRTQVDVAQQLGVTQKRVSEIESADILHTEYGTLARSVDALGGRLKLVADFGDHTVTIR
jgi:hypothetical protein